MPSNKSPVYPRNLFNILRKDITFCPSQSKYTCNSPGSLFLHHIFNFPVTLFHFTSELFTIHHKAYLPCPPSKLLLYNPSYFFPLYFSLLAYKPASFPFSPSFLTSTSTSEEFLLLMLLLTLCSPVLAGLFAGPPSLSLSGVSACEASAVQCILLIESILCIITPSCLWVQLAQLGPSV